MIQSIFSERRRLDTLFSQLNEASADAPLHLQHVYSNHIILKTGGYLENSTKAIFKEYCARSANQQIANYVDHHISRLNSLSSEKLEKLLKSFQHEDKWNSVVARCISEELEAIDSVKAIRDKIAHGGSNGTGFTAAVGYFKNVCNFVEYLESELVPY